MKSDLYILLHILLSYISSGTAVCYDPSGDSVSDPSFQPCGNSMCCATNRTNPPGGNYDHGFTADQCLENGLCENKIQVNYEDGDTGLVTLYYREYCTSSNWTNNAGGRLDVCTEQTNPGVGISNYTIVMTPCDGTSNSSTWCCGSSSSCCGTDSVISIAQTLGLGLPTTTTTSSSTRTPIPTTTATTATTTTNTPTSQSSVSTSSSSSLSSGAKAGIGVGVSLGSIGIIATALGLFFLRRRRVSTDKEERTPRPGITTAEPDNYSHVKAQEKPHDPVEYVGEMPASPRYELPSGTS